MRNNWKLLILAGCGLICLSGIGCGTMSPSRNAPVMATLPTQEVREAARTPQTEFATLRSSPQEMSSGIFAAGYSSRETPGTVLAGVIPEQDSNINLALALELAGVDNPTINLAREAVQEAEAGQLQAKALVLPTLSFGTNLRIHRGVFQRSSGSILDVNSQSLFFGAGSRVVGSSTVANPGVRLFYPLADILLEPRAAQQRVISLSAEANAVNNNVLLDVATAYLELLQADAALEAMRVSEGEYQEIVRLTSAYAKAGQGRLADANRAKANIELLHRQIQETEGERAVISARLASLLNLDPSQSLIPPGGLIQPLRFFVNDLDLENFVNHAYAVRPEVVARTAEVAEANTRLRQEKLRPWLPTLSVGFSAGSFGGGSNQTSSSLGNFGGRTDFDVIAAWTLRNSGVGNHALQNQTLARVGQAIARLEQTRNQIRAEVSEAHALLKSSESRIKTARRQLTTAEEGFAEEMKRIKQTEARILEVLDSTRQLSESRLDLIRAVTDYNLAQFRLFAAIGTSPGSVRLPE